jgi:hypothetical protein
LGDSVQTVLARKRARQLRDVVAVTHADAVVEAVLHLDVDQLDRAAVGGWRQAVRGMLLV